MVYFKEEQRFNQKWLWAMIITVDMLIAGVVLTNFNSKTDFLLSIALGIIPLFLINWLLLSAKLLVEIKNQTIYYKFVPFHLRWKKIRKHEIEKYEVVEYSPIKDYGGWGMRHGFSKGKAFNVKGNKGLKVYLKNGKPLLFGTQKPGEISRTMEAMMEQNEEDYG